MGNVTMPQWMQQQMDALNAPRPQRTFPRFRGSGPGIDPNAPPYEGNSTGAPAPNSGTNAPTGPYINAQGQNIPDSRGIYAPSLPGQVAGNGGQWGAPSTGLLSYGGTSTTPFSSNFGGHMGGGPGSTGDQYAHYLAARPNSIQAQKVAAMPQSFNVQQFNQVAQRNPVLAEAMAAQGGQKFQNAIMQGNGWMQDQMNQFLNQYGSGAQPGFGPDQMALLRSMGIG